MLGWLLGKEQFLGIIRHVVTFVGGLLVAKGNLDPTAIESIGGGIVALAGIIWSTMAPEKTPLTAEKVIAVLEPAKTKAIEKVLAKTEPTPIIPPLGPP